MTRNTVTKLRFRANISNMGDGMIIWVPLAMHEMAKQLKTKKNLMITVDDENGPQESKGKLKK